MSVIWSVSWSACHHFQKGRGDTLPCSSKNGAFVVLKRLDICTYIYIYLSLPGDPSTGVWLGGSDNGHEGTWAWFPTGRIHFSSVIRHSFIQLFSGNSYYSPVHSFFQLFCGNHRPSIKGWRQKMVVFSGTCH